MDEIERATSALHALDPGADREQWVRIGMSAKDAGVSLADFDAWSSPASNYSGEHDVAQVWKSFNGDGVKAATLFGMAIAAGWQDPAKSSARRINGSRPIASIAKAVKALPVTAMQAEATKPLHDPLMLWNECKPADIHQEYIERKLGLPDELRVYRGSLNIAGQACDGALVLPVRTLAGELCTLQFIPREGKKVFMPGVKLAPDACLVIGGTLDNAERIFVCEGIGQAWSAHQATRAPAVVTFGAGRMAGVAKTLRQNYPSARLALIADVGKESQCAAIAADVDGAWIEMPEGKSQNFDLNDFHKEAGDLAAVSALLERTKGAPLRFNLLSDADLAERPMLQQRIKDVFPLVGTAAVFGASGSGKSFLIVDAMQAIAFCKSWFDYRVKPCNVIYCALEGEGGIAGRVKAYRIRHGASSDRIRYLLQPFSLLADADVVDLAHAIEAAGGAGKWVTSYLL